MGIEKNKIIFIICVLFMATLLMFVNLWEAQPFTQKQQSVWKYLYLFPTAQPHETVISNQTPTPRDQLPESTAQPIPTQKIPVPPAPKIYRVTPEQGGSETEIIITGSGFLPTENIVVTTLEEFKNVPSFNGTTLHVTIKGPQSIKDTDPTILDFYNKTHAKMEYQIGVINKNGQSNFAPFIFQLYE